MSTSTEIAPYQTRPVTRQAASYLAGSVTDSWVLVVTDVVQLAEHICRTEFVPKNYRNNAPATAAAILAGRELGLPPMTSLRHVHVVDGSPSLSAEYKRARVLAAGHDFEILELSLTRCRVSGQRKGSGRPPLEITFTIEDARRAKLVKPNGGYELRPRRMLFARASTELCDFLFADVTNGLPTTELLAEGDSDDEFSGYNESPGQAAPKTTAEQVEPPKPRTAQRRTRQAEKPADPPAAAGPAATAPSATAPGPDAPPFPGEDDPAPVGPAGGNGERHAKLVGIVQQHFKRLGYADADRATRLLDCERIAGSGPLDSTNDLTDGQLSVVADTVARCKTRAQLNALLSAGDKPGDQAGQDAAERAFQAGDTDG